MNTIDTYRKELNFRDLGGLETYDGRRVRNGFFYRGVRLSAFTDEELEIFKSLKIRTIMDLRSLAEIQSDPDPELEGSTYIPHSGLSVEGSEDIDWSPTGMSKTGAAGQDQLRQIQEYNKKIPINNEAYRIMMKEIKAGRVPIYLHCFTGKDRTGVAAMIILLALGVKDEEIRKDYLISNEYYADILEEKRRDIDKEKEPEHYKLKTIMFGVLEETYETIMNSIKEKYENFDEYIKKEFAFSDEELAEFRNRYLE